MISQRVGIPSKRRRRELHWQPVKYYVTEAILTTMAGVWWRDICAVDVYSTAEHIDTRLPVGMAHNAPPAPAPHQPRNVPPITLSTAQHLPMPLPFI